MFDETGKRQIIELLLKGPDKTTWQQISSNKLGRLAQGNKFGIQGIDILEFISKDLLPQNLKITCMQFLSVMPDH